MAAVRLGLIVNPLAGIGGRVGLKGSDGIEIQSKAFALGAVPQSGERAIQTLVRLAPLLSELELITYPGEMGAQVARLAGFEPRVIGIIQPGKTTPQDTQQAAQAMQQIGVDLILFAGGDGTARDIYTAIGEEFPVLGIPAGVKIHSAVFAVTPDSAGELARLALSGRVGYRKAEVMDVDEEAYRLGSLVAHLYGYLSVPYRRDLVQSAKAASNPGEAAAMEAIAIEIVNRMQPGMLYVIGPGTTTRAIHQCLGLPKTLLGVDVVQDRRVVELDVNEAQLLKLLAGMPAQIVVTPIGGQGYLFGRGNQQISPAVIRLVDTHNIVVASTKDKIHALQGQPLLVDTGDPELDQTLEGYTRIITGYHEEIVYRVTASF